MIRAGSERATTLIWPSPRLWIVRALVFLVLLALAAGCTGKDNAAGAVPDAIQQLAGPSEEELARTPGILQGIVHTPGLSPIAGAHVAEARLGTNVTTDAAGYFQMSGLVTGEHLLIVSAPDHVTRSLLVNTQNGTTLEVNVSLTAAPRLDPYVETRELQGFLTCAALVNGEAHDCASADPNHRDVFEFELGNDGRLVVLELQWDATSTPAGSTMSLAVETVGYGAQDVDLGNATGSGYARVVVPETIMAKYYPEGGLMRARVALAPSEAPVSFTAQTQFVVYVSTFYHEPGPAEFTVITA